jgi:hypothetical protein
MNAYTERKGETKKSRDLFHLPALMQNIFIR